MGSISSGASGKGVPGNEAPPPTAPPPTAPPAPGSPTAPYVPPAPGSPTAPYVPPPPTTTAPPPPTSTGGGHWEPGTGENGNDRWVPDPPGTSGGDGGYVRGTDPIKDAIDDFTKNIAPTQYNFANTTFSGIPQGAVDAAGNAYQGYGAALGGLGGKAGGQFNDLLNRNQQIASNDDPRFAAYAEGQNAVLQNQRNSALNAVRQENARQGIVGTASQNDITRANAPYDAAQQALYGSIGMQQMGRQDQALRDRAALLGQGTALGTGIIGQQAGMTQQQFQNVGTTAQANNDATRQWLEAQAALSASYASDPAMRIAALAAQQGGNVGGGKSNPLSK